MKKLYTSMLVCLIAMIAPALASASSCIVNIDDADHITAQFNGTTLNLVTGDNVVEFEGYGSSLILTTTGDYLITELTEQSASGYSYTTSVFQNTKYIYPSDGNVYIVKTGILEEMRTGSFTINVDDPTRVDATLQGTYSLLELNQGENTVKFIPGIEVSLSLSPAEYGQTIYKVTKNGETASANYGQYDLYIEEDMVVDIQTKFPDLPATVAFEYTGDSQGIITAVSVNGTEIEDFANGFTAKLGDSVALTLNTTDYKFNSIQLNDNAVQTWTSGTYTATLTETENVIKINADKYKNFTATLKLSNPAQVNVYRGSSYYGTLLTDLQEGENTVELNTANSQITIVAASGCYISSVTKDGETVSANYNNQYEVFATEDMVIEVVSGEIVRDNTLVIYIDDMNAAPHGCAMTRSDRSAITITSGYNLLKFADSDLPFYLSFYGPAMCYGFINGETLVPTYEGGSSFQVDEAADGDVIKVYMAAAPATHTLSFAIDSDIHVANAIHDHFTPFDHTAGLSVLTGTMVSIEPVESTANLEAYLDSEELPATDGKYSFTATADHSFVLKAVNTGIENVSVENAADTDVYNLQGVRVATDGQTRQLPAGIYVVGGRKVVVR